jgi:predicted nucleotidyltransferase
MQTSLSHLPEHKQEQIRAITDTIIRSVGPEKVILFGSHATGRWVEHRYSEGGITYVYISDCNILVITRAGNERKDSEMQDIIENRLHFQTPVTVIVPDIKFVEGILSDGSAGNLPLIHQSSLTRSLRDEDARQKLEQRQLPLWLQR